MSVIVKMRAALGGYGASHEYERTFPDDAAADTFIAKRDGWHEAVDGDGNPRGYEAESKAPGGYFMLHQFVSKRIV